MWNENRRIILLESLLKKLQGAVREESDEIKKEVESQKNQIAEMNKKIAELQDIIEKQNGEKTSTDILIKSIAKEMNKIFENDRKNLTHQLTRVAAMETANYIVKNMTKVRSFSKVQELWEYALNAVNIEGIYLEFGVYSGRSINFFSNYKKDVKFYGFDSFEGLSEDWRTGFPKGIFKCNEPDVNENVTLIKGYFENTLPDFVSEHKEVCTFVHIDCDLYSSAKVVFDCLKQKIVRGTIIIFDEYFNYPDWQNGEYKAFQEFVSENKISYEYIAYRDTHEQVVVRIL